MRILAQRIINGNVVVEGNITGEIKNGILAYVGFKSTDTIDEIKYLAKKLVNLRIFEDESKRMNKSVLDINGEILTVSQFTLYGNTTHGNRPSFTDAMEATKAKEFYEIFNDELRTYNINVEEGIFQAEMYVSYTNVGPITLMLEK